MILQTITEHQGHILIRIAVVALMLLGFLLVFGYFNRKRKKTKSDDPDILNFSYRDKRKGKKKRRKVGKN